MTDADGPSLPPAAAPTQSFVLVGSIIVTIGALYVGAGIFVPLVLAVLLTFALAPIVRALHRLHIPHVLAVLISVLAAAILIGFLAYLIASQLARLATELPQYQQIVGDKVRALQSMGGGDVFERIAGAIQSIGAPGASAPSTAEGSPLPVTVVNPPETPFGFAQIFLTSLLGPLATAAIVTVFVVFLLLEHGDFRDRFLKLVSRGDLRTSTKVVNEAGKRVSRYLLVQFSVNLSYGFLFGLGLFFIGVPNPILWGLFAALFRYIPFVGTLIAASVPFALAFAIDPGWRMLLSAVGLFVCLELVVTNAIEPRLYGSSTGLSALAVIVAAMFWATLWGPIGLILATPLTVCLVVLGRYVPQLHFLEIMLGSEPVLVREEQLYQRLLSGNLEEAIDLGENYIAQNSTEAFFDDIAFPVLRLAEADRARNLTDVASRRLVADGMAALVREFEPDEVEGDEPAGTPAVRVLCIGGRTELDSAAANMLAQVISQEGITTKVLPPISVRPEGIAHIDLEGIDAVCIAYLDANPRTYAKFVAKRLKRRAPQLRVIACFANVPPSANDISQLGLDAIVATSAAAKDWVLGLTDERQPAHANASDQSDRLAWALGLQSLVKSGPRFDAMIADITKRFDADMAIVSLADDLIHEGVSVPVGESGQSHASVAALSQQVITADAALIIADASSDAAHAQNAFLLINDIRFYAGMPLRSPNGDAIGVLSVMSHSPRTLAADELVALENAASELATSISPAEPTRGQPSGSTSRVAAPANALPG
ncbi:AI-2E family transporter [uncultured Devosia sp.]|uniref:AI-2E family transporter n=1 Tax=uncultured Devosia sp. TaxID=211434 RepID=UPI0035C9B2CC